MKILIFICRLLLLPFIIIRDIALFENIPTIEGIKRYFKYGNTPPK